MEIENILEGDNNISDVRVLWILQNVLLAFKHAKIDKIKAFVTSDTTLKCVQEFICSKEIRFLLFSEQPATKQLKIYTEILKQKQPEPIRLYLMKLNKSALTEENFKDEMLVGSNLDENALNHLAYTLKEVYLPLVANPMNQAGWPEMVSSGVMNYMSNFLTELQIISGQMNGQTCLPLPPNTDMMAEQDNGAVPTTSATAKDKVHTLEGCLITWTKQIKNILKLDPESILNHSSNHPGPSAEIHFWEAKAKNLNSIFDQLQSDNIRAILQFLDQSKSTYNIPFAKLCKEVFYSRVEANSNVKLLSAMKVWFEKLENETVYANLIELFRPILHSILLIWKWSRHYNTPARLVVLMREICNEIIRKSCSFLNGDTLFELVEAEETSKAVEMLRSTLKICANFKSTYFDYKAKANAECPNNQWRIQNNALFLRLDGFLERCHDILELTLTILQFNKLSKIEVGGTKGKTLTTSVFQIYYDFQESVNIIRNVSYDIMDLDAKGFDDDFYEFRSKIKELERRLASVINQAFDDCNSISGRFKMLDSFDELLERSIIKNELEKKHSALLKDYSIDLYHVQQIFIDNRDNPPIAHNLPPFTGSLYWCRGLLERIKIPMDKLKHVNRLVLEREDSKEVVKTYTTLTANLSEYEHNLVRSWSQSIEASSQAKLKLPLLRRDQDSSLLNVNFDSALVKLLREVKYFVILGLSVPDSAISIYKKAEVFRRQTGNLDLIVNMYNNIQTKLLAVEKPLVKSHLDKIDQILNRGLRSLNWKSHGIDLFLKESMTDVNEANILLGAMKTNLQRVEELLSDWSKNLLFERTGKALSLAEFEESQTTIRSSRYGTMKEGGAEIHRLLKDTLKRLKVSQGSPDWRAYVDFINNIAVTGLAAVIVLSLEYLHKQIDPTMIEAEDLSPLIEIELDLYGKDLVFFPSVEERGDQGGLCDCIMRCVDNIINVCSVFKRLDGVDGTYLKEMRENPEIRRVISDITKCIRQNEKESNNYRQEFKKYEYLWTTDLSIMFSDFLSDSLVQANNDTEELELHETGEIIDKELNLDLNKFDEKIHQFMLLQGEVSDIKASRDICFIRVNSQPIKQALSTWVTKWVYMFTQYLHDRVINKLTWLDDFMSNINKGLDIEVAVDNKDALLECMSHIRDVRKLMAHTSECFTPLNEIVALLKSHGISIETSYIYSESASTYLEKAPIKWDNTVNKTFKKKEVIQSLQNQMIETIRKNIVSFQEKVDSFRQLFLKEAPFDSLLVNPQGSNSYNNRSTSVVGTNKVVTTTLSLNTAMAKIKSGQEYTLLDEIDDAYITLDKFDVLLNDIEKEARELNNLEELFELSKTKHVLLIETRRDLSCLKMTWDMNHLIYLVFRDWQVTLWNDIETETLLDEIKEIFTQIKQLPPIAKSWGICQVMNDRVANMNTVLPLVHSLHSPAMRERHWKSLMSLTRKHFEMGLSTFCLQDVVNLELHRYVTEVNDVVEVAIKELKIESQLKNIENHWKTLALEFIPYRDGSSYVLNPPDAIIESLEEQQMSLQGMIGMGKFVDYFRERVLYWQGCLGTVDSVLKLWISVQKQWSSLEAIFLKSADIRTQLPDDTSRFETIDSELKDLLKEVHSMPVVLEACTSEGREQLLNEMHVELEKCQKALNEYLDMKKNIFPRFYFVSNVSLLDILSNGNNPPKVVPHLGDCFDGISSLTFDDGAIDIAVSACSKDGEILKFHSSFYIRGAVENWLNDLVLYLQESLRLTLSESVETAALWEVENARHQWVFDYPAQLSLLGCQILWTEEVENALDELENGQEDAVKKYHETCTQRLNELITLVQGDLGSNDRTKIITLITVDVHARDVIHLLIDKKIETSLDFTWQSQLRYYYMIEENTKATSIRICDFSSSYSYEYIGNPGRLVITPLTDRCYVTLTTALRLMLGGAPAGPAGTGKTETTKDLARGLGLQCYVFNCSDQMNYQTMADIFKGLSQTGAWGCFDEFNRIPVEVLSVVATQVKIVLDAIIYLSLPLNRDPSFQHLPVGKPPVVVGSFNFFNEIINLIPTCGFFITMNPGYAGRTELPENLKALFRSCAMIRPDLQPICENMLMAEGFLKARSLSVKFVTLYELSVELLSKQVHYDWGLRAVKSVLRVAGELKRSEPNVNEEHILMRALRDFNVPKIILQDVSIFLGLISDLFPNVSVPTKLQDDLKHICSEVCMKGGLQPEDSFIKKVIQYDEVLGIRHSVMLLGPAGCGKTTIWKTLAKCHNVSQSKATTVYETINPKTLSSDELYGFMTLSKDWKDGALSIIMRNMSKEWSPYTAHQNMKWVILDGDIDAVWIESMNTVMDDNKVLTLVSNERIPLTASMRMIFEINSLRNATPATVSRAGIIFVNESDIGWAPYVESWVQTRQKENEKMKFPALFSKYVETTIQLLKDEKLPYIVPMSAISQVTTLCRLLDSVFSSLNEADATAEVMESLFIFCTMWAFGGSLDPNTETWNRFSNLWKSNFRCNSSGKGSGSTSVFPDKNHIFDYYYSVEHKEFKTWQSGIDNSDLSSTIDCSHFSSSVIIPTAQSIRLTCLLNLIVNTNNPVLLIGSAGTGKTALIRDFLHNFNTEDNNAVANINLNYYTDSTSLQYQLEQSVDKRSGRIYGPRNNKKLMYFLDDLNMPYVEEYGTQTHVALIRQFVDYSGWYDRTDLSVKKIFQDIQFIAAMNHKCGSFNINNRLVRHFSVFSVLMPSKQDLNAIYTTIMSGHFNSFSNESVKLAIPVVVKATVDLYFEVCEGFLPSAQKFHYLFNMRDLSGIAQGILQSRAEYYPTRLKVLRLWMHECTRVFSDRMISFNEIGRFKELLGEQAKKNFDEETDELIKEPLIFTNFVTNSMDNVPVYMPLIEKNDLKKALEIKLQQYNELFPVMSLVLFDQAMEHIARITRIISIPNKSALLVGVGGSGKQSLSKLATFLCEYQLETISVTSQYGVLDLKEDLKELYKKTGVRPATPHVLLITDSQIIDERFLVYINDILSSGLIADLFTPEEYDSIIISLRNEAKKQGIPVDSRDQMIEFFIDRVLTNLHLILSFSPVGEAFRLRSRRFPNLINCTTIDWFHMWPKDALISVSQTFLQEIDLNSDPIHENVCHHMADVHLSVIDASVKYKASQGRFNYVTPTSFLELIVFYKGLLKEKRELQQHLINRLDVGLKTLHKTAEDVEGLQIDLKVTMEKVDEKKKATEALLEQMGKQRSEAEKKSALADIEKEKAAIASQKASEIEKEASVELAHAKPALDASHDALQCLNKSSLTELKSMQKPPSGVDKVTTAVLMMIKGETKNFSWDNAKKMMAKVDAFKTTLENYKAEEIPEEIVNKVQTIMEDPNFTFEKMKSKSLAAANLCVWVINIITFNKVYRKVKPLMDALEEAKLAKDNADAQLQSVALLVAEVEAQLEKMQLAFREATNEKAKVEAEANANQERLNLASRLVNGLASENERWMKEIDRLREGESTLIGDALLAAAFVSYIGAFDAHFREQLWKETWSIDLVHREIPLTDISDNSSVLDPTQMLANDSAIAQWMNDGLPADRMSIENGCIISSCKRWPLLIDPQLQGIKWLMQREANSIINHGEGMSESNLVVIQVTQPNWMKQIEIAITQGSSVILENLSEHIDAVLDPIFMRQIYRKGRNWFLRLRGEELEYNMNFRLFLQTKLANPHYPPEITAQCTLINFIVTVSGLEDQLLAQVVNKEQPDLEEEKQQLQQAFNAYKIELLALENQLLERLANAPEDILSDVPLIEGLEATKATANEISKAVEKGKQTELVINKARNVYRPVAAEGSMLYFLMVQLCCINHMYQYSLDTFITFFFKSMAKVPRATKKGGDEEVGEDQSDRVYALRESLRFTMYQMVSRGLFEDHKQAFLTQLVFNLMKKNVIGQESGYSSACMLFLLRLPKAICDDNPIEWLTDSQWQSLQALTEIDGFERFVGDLEESEPRFKEWYTSATPESEKLPLDWRELDKTPFLKLLVIRCMRPDRLFSAITHFINTILPNGIKYTTCDSELNSFQVLKETFEGSTNINPIYFVLSPGVDIVADVDRLAHQNEMEKGVNYHNISLGQGQDVVAMAKLTEGRELGHWVVLNNVHLMPRWLIEVDKKLEEYSKDLQASHERFRVFISSDASKYIPIGILSRSIKLTNEPPSGLKANLKRALCNFSKTEVDELEQRTRSILFGMCYFHAIMLERKKFGPQGFNMMYPFALGDLLSSAVVLRNYMENAPSKVPWRDLRYLFGEIMYGGHIVNDFDRLVCGTYLEYFLRDELLDELVMFPYLDDKSGSHNDSQNSRMAPFLAPKTSCNFERLLDHIESSMPSDTPLAFGLHPNAEIAFRTEAGEGLFKTMLELQPKHVGGGDAGESMQVVAEGMLQDILDTYRDLRFDLSDIVEEQEKDPFQNVFLQECQRMNDLLNVLTMSLAELDLGFRGDLTMTENMEALMESLYLDQIPAIWQKVSFPSLRGLGSWLTDLGNRIAQLQEWIANPLEVPVVTWISGLFNPQSFLTAIMQTASQKNNLELNKLIVVTEVTKRSKSSIDAPSREGQYISGLSLEGARWDLSSAIIDSSLPKEMHCPMPVINCRAALSERKDHSNVFDCPVYKTQQRGPTYVFTAQLRTKSPPSKWVLAGAVLIMDIA